MRLVINVPVMVKLNWVRGSRQFTLAESADSWTSFVNVYDFDSTVNFKFPTK